MSAERTTTETHELPPAVAKPVRTDTLALPMTDKEQ